LRVRLEGERSSGASKVFSVRMLLTLDHDGKDPGKRIIQETHNMWAYYYIANCDGAEQVTWLISAEG
jgi:hypothetical protein